MLATNKRFSEIVCSMLKQFEKFNSSLSKSFNAHWPMWTHKVCGIIRHLLGDITLIICMSKYSSIMVSFKHFLDIYLFYALSRRKGLPLSTGLRQEKRSSPGASHVTLSVAVDRSVRRRTGPDTKTTASPSWSPSKGPGLQVCCQLLNSPLLKSGIF